MGSFLSAVYNDNDVRNRIRTTIWDSDLEFLCSWMEGSSYSDLYGFFLKPLKSKPTQVHIDRAIQEAVHAVERYSLLLNWSAHYTNVRLLEYLATEKHATYPSPELGNLSQYIRWGVNHPLSVFVREELKWDNRAEAIALGCLTSPEVAYSANKEEFRKTLREASEGVLIDILGTAEKAYDLRKQLG